MRSPEGTHPPSELRSTPAYQAQVRVWPCSLCAQRNGGLDSGGPSRT